MDLPTSCERLLVLGRICDGGDGGEGGTWDSASTSRTDCSLTINWKEAVVKTTPVRAIPAPENVKYAGRDLLASVFMARYDDSKN